VPSRCFLAIPLPAPAVRALVSARSAFLETAPAWAGEKWVRPELLHVTVAFFGNVPDDRLEALLAALGSMASLTPPFQLRLTGARAVPSQRRASMIWASLDGDVAAVSAVRDRALAAAGCAPDRRGFSPHVTLARARVARRVHHLALRSADDILSEAGKTEVGSVSVPSLTVFSSTFDGAGPSYRELARTALSGTSETPAAD
jgi:RNA 2',3'-cyclic 3'-phosphodiesterase